MKKALSATLILGSAAAVLAGVGCRKNPDEPRVIVAGVTFHVEVADTDQARRRGLSGRKSLPEERGMLFVFDRPQVLQFHMKDCYFPIDVAFMDEAGRIINLATMAVEADPANPVATYLSHRPAKYVLETAGGTWRRIAAKPGMTVEFLGLTDAR